MVPGRHAGQLSHLNWMTCVNKRTGYNMMKKTEPSYKSGQCYVSSLTGQTGRVWLPELVPASHTRRCWPEDQRGRRSAGWPPWPPSLPGRHTPGWWTHTGTVHQHKDRVFSKKVNSLENVSLNKKDSTVKVLSGVGTSCTRLSRSVCVRVTAMTFAPQRARARAVARPIPGEPSMHRKTCDMAVLLVSHTHTHTRFT